MNTRIPKLKRLDEWRWRIERDESRGMNTHGIVFSSDRLIEPVREDESLAQVANVATLPGIAGPSMAMPDIHRGYGFPIGGVAAFDAETGVISPGGVGYDINCGINLTRTKLELDEVRPLTEKLADALYAGVPAGVGEGGEVQLSHKQVREVAAKGGRWALERGDVSENDLERMEEGGRLESADPGAISDRAAERGRDQVGTLGSGNHFLEIQVVDELFDPNAAQVLGLREGQIVAMVHSGSRGFGYQVCQEQLKAVGDAPRKYGIELADRQLACAPVDSEEGRAYLGAMAAAANYAWANRLTLAGTVRRIFERVFERGEAALGMGLVLDITHNIAKFETHEVDGRERRLVVHRKGATRAFGPGDPRVPAPYRSIGQPILIPGDMGTASYVLVGAASAAERSFGSACHGAGRVKSRRAAKKSSGGRDLMAELDERGVTVRARTMGTVKEEMPEAYKDVSEVVRAAEGAGLANPVARLKPLIVVKG